MVAEQQTTNATTGLPEIGRPDPYYLHEIAVAEQQNDVQRRATLKVARYVTLALSPTIPWDEKQRYFSHVLRHHCIAHANDRGTVACYQQLADFVRQHAGAEALRLASQEDDMYAARAALGQDRRQIEDDAEVFFGRILGTGDHRPEWFNEVDWSQLKLIRDQWI